MFALALFSAAGSGCGDLREDPEWREITIARGKGVNESVATADERTVIFSTTGPGPLLVVTDQDFKVLKQIDGGYHLAMAESEQAVCGASPLRLVVLSLPELSGLATMSLPEWGFPLVRSCPRGWLYANLDSQAIVELNAGLHVSGGATAHAPVRGLAVDPLTGNVIACGRKSAEVFDARMAPLASLELDGEVSDVVATDGCAWIATADGALIRVAMASGTITWRTATGCRGDVGARLDCSGRELAASWCGRAGDEFAVALRVFRCASDGAVEVARRNVTQPRGVNDLTLLPLSKRIVVGTPRSAFVWHYAKGGG